MMSQISPTLIREHAMSLGFHKIGIAGLDHDDRAEKKLQTWLDRGYQADMEWMARPQRQNVRLLMPEARSVLSVALNYYTDHQHSPDPKIGKISRYAWGRDYHRIMHKKLKTLCQWLESQYPEIKTCYYADTAPIQDKVWAERSGLGWIAKNGNLITKDYGSWVFLGEVVTNLELPPDPPHTQHCGSCTRCLEACPTGAIVQPFVVDANRCIAYHTIENRSPELPPEITQNLGGWVAGCDICQDVCPWNQRFAQPTDVADFQPYPENLEPPLAELANITEAEWDRRFTGSALRRIKPPMLRRNAQANLANS